MGRIPPIVIEETTMRKTTIGALLLASLPVALPLRARRRAAGRSVGTAQAASR